MLAGDCTLDIYQMYKPLGDNPFTSTSTHIFCVEYWSNLIRVFSITGEEIRPPLKVAEIEHPSLIHGICSMNDNTLILVVGHINQVALIYAYKVSISTIMHQ